MEFVTSAFNMHPLWVNVMPARFLSLSPWFFFGGALVLSVLLMPPFLHYLQQQMMGQYIREDGPQQHQAKAGTPTMGGLITLISALAVWFTGMIYSGALDPEVLTSSMVPSLWVVAITIVFGLLGLTDDYLKVAKKHNKGLSGYSKMAVQILMGLLVGIYVVLMMDRSSVSLPGGFVIELGWLYPLFAMFVVNGASNAVNITDGLDGLACSTLFLSFMTATALLMFAPETIVSSSKGMLIPLQLLCMCFAGANLGFLVFNKHPAKIFMGDTGSLAMGGTLGALAVVSGMEFLLALFGILFVLETLSVILQVASFKLTGKRIFRMAPLHHHFELGGMNETQVMKMFVGIQFAGCLIAMWFTFFL